MNLSPISFLFFAQGKSLGVYHELLLRLQKKRTIDKVGFYVANREYYQSFLRTNPDFEKNFVVLKEWDIYAEAETHHADLNRIHGYEKKLGDPTLWSPWVTDRRLFMGQYATWRQNYCPARSPEKVLAILDLALQKIEMLFDRVMPHVVFTLYTATFGDCLAHLFAASRGIRSLDLRMARLKNYVMFVDGVTEPPPHIAKLYKRFESGIPSEWRQVAEAYLEGGKKSLYEGKPLKSGAEKKIRLGSFLSRCFFPKTYLKLYRLIQEHQKSKQAPFRFCPQHFSPLIQTFLKDYWIPWNAKSTQKKLADILLKKEDLKNLDYGLYPLHTEPELVLSQFARPYLNQIEVIRNIRLSLPITMTLVVKEHPMMIGKRSFRYYKKILEIPNVRLADFSLPSEILLEQTKIVVVIRGAIGLEAVIRKKPVLSLGKSLFDILPPTLFRSCWNLYELPQAIQETIQNYRPDPESLIRYLAAVMAGSTPVNLISDLIGKAGRERSEVDAGAKEHPHWNILTEHLLKRILDDSIQKF